ncbi:hypothetical protein HF086_011113 [Spodoptera exigua]|uniref:Fatty acyl-CoA reductase n=1 Tax=Spodoptera exigua TaxID=7107 RepID=A0A922SS52_SPOEX|nr:hypothetical protein HF086_011113 [Spodoptera exigua]
MADPSQVRSFYAGKNFFITGGTGFVGLCLIEKILRCIPDSGKIYLLMRPKKGKEIADRLQEFPKNPVFEKLLESNSTDVFKKLIPIAGDVGEENLGMSPQDRQTIIDNVNVVMIHVSSAYVNSYLTEAHEKIYEAPEDPEKVISLVGTLNDEALLEIEPKLLKSHPNTYTFTKHLAEHEVVKCADLFPCTIVRPTMIVASWKEPIPGWTCSKVGPQGFLMGAAKADYIPVDVVVNQLLVAGWEAANSSSGLTVYHCSSSTCHPFTWTMLDDTVNGMLHKYPLKSAVW